MMTRPSSEISLRFVQRPPGELWTKPVVVDQDLGQRSHAAGLRPIKRIAVLTDDDRAVGVSGKCSASVAGLHMTKALHATGGGPAERLAGADGVRLANNY